MCHEKREIEFLFRNCINDGRWPAVHAFQQECTNRLKVLCSKGKVLNVQVKGVVRHQVSVMELNVNEPLTTCRKDLSRRQNCRYSSHRQDNCNGQADYWLQVFRHLSGKNITQAFIRNVRGLLINVQKMLQQEVHIKWLPRPEDGIRLSLLPNPAAGRGM